MRDKLSTPAQPPEPKEHKPGDGLPDNAPEGLKEAAGGELAEGHSDEAKAEAAEKERGALDFMLSDPTPAKFKVETLVDTPDGLRKLIFHMHQLDGARIEALEVENAEGTGPFAKVDRQALNVDKITEATDLLVDANGKKVDPNTEAFYGAKLAAKFAFEAMFKLQPGVAEGLATEIDRMAGMTRDRVGIAEREMANAVGNS